VDFRIYHHVNNWARDHAGFVGGLATLENALVVVIVVAALALWLAARPGGSSRWKLAAASALASGALGYLVNQVFHAVHDRARPYEAHAGVWHPDAASTDASFPSDHASAAFGIAWAVFLYDRAVGAVFLAIAVALSWLRVVIGFHYPGDVLAGAGVGLVCALVVVKLLRPLIAFLVRLVERATDPVVRPLWRRAAS
jgi:membrane-associated phospholipid phosphatase